MTQPPFNPGDSVKLISGGPVMTVSKVVNGSVKCVWFNTSLSTYNEVTLISTLLIKQAPFGS